MISIEAVNQMEQLTLTANPKMINDVLRLSDRLTFVDSINLVNLTLPIKLGGKQVKPALKHFNGF